MREKLVLWFLLIIASSSYGLSEYFDEKLTLTTLSNNELRVNFQFSSGREFNNKTESGNYLTFPRIIQELLNRYSVRRLTVTMAHGRWNLNNWGLPPQPSSPAGAQVFAEFEVNREEEVDEHMKFLVEALNGVLCTSIAHISVITSPEFAILQNHKNNKAAYRRYGVLSGETTCTENLTRLRKLLACKENGISTLLHPSKLYNSVYHSSSLVIEQDCNKDECKSKMELGVNAVIRNPSQKTQRHWSLADVFDRKLGSKCQVARVSVIAVVGPSGEITKTDAKNLTISGSEPFELYIPVTDISKKQHVVKAWSSQGGFEQKHGVLTVHIANDESDSEIEVSQIIPYYVHLRYSQIKWRCDKNGVPNIQQVFKNSKHLEAPTLLQYKMLLSDGQTCELIIPFDKQLLRLEQYPADANHGMHIPAASVYIQKQSSMLAYTIHSNAILVLLPVPDFSMPFNVICFVATAFALVFGPIQLYSTLWLAPVVKKSHLARKIHRAILLAIIAFCLYAHMMDINLNEIRRGIETYFEKLNELK